MLNLYNKNMRLIFGLEIAFYYLWAVESENLSQWFLYALGMWIVGYYIHKFNWEKRKNYRLAIVLYSVIIFAFILSCRLFSLVGNNIAL